jgi:hypothetical protein
MMDGLEALNSMVNSWMTERLMVPSIGHDDFTLISGQQDYSFGTGGDFDADRPAKIEFAGLTVNGLATTAPYFREVSDDEWEAIPDKTTSGIPYCYHIDHTSPEMNISFYPVPDGAYTFTPYVWKSISEFALGDVITLPPGYHRLLKYGLAIEIAPEYGKQPDPAIIADYTITKANIKRLNQPDLKMESDLALRQRGVWNINTGQIN